ncbi:hypothetical protein ebA406 [Aromatoleum aromaticum EbN1]|uniref:Uncharacterized protein n=1 Tax=Aromatoleum aromaticum (strain DSM 19018 / LMG 30748 / EbN1) TaxID=76114 RepID=Q5P8M6_AROAE|nr:hypothetical protein ebA406 [Aromatoleum aromaticum EbN1]
MASMPRRRIISAAQRTTTAPTSSARTSAMSPADKPAACAKAAACSDDRDMTRSTAVVALQRLDRARLAGRAEVIGDAGADHFQIAGEVLVLKVDPGAGWRVAPGGTDLTGEEGEFVLEAGEVLALAIVVGVGDGEWREGGDGERERQQSEGWVHGDSFRDTS